MKTGETRTKALDSIFEALDAVGTAVVDAGDFVREVCERLRRHASLKGVKLIIFATCGGVRVSMRAFAEALFELVDSAIADAGRGSSVIVTVRPAIGDTVSSRSIVLAQLVVEGVFLPTARIECQ